MKVNQMSFDEMTVDEMSCYHAAAVVLLGERGIREGEAEIGKKEKELKSCIFSLFSTDNNFNLFFSLHIHLHSLSHSLSLRLTHAQSPFLSLSLSQNNNILWMLQQSPIGKQCFLVEKEDSFLQWYSLEGGSKFISSGLPTKTSTPNVC
jgi:hypothetical protein